MPKIKRTLAKTPRRKDTLTEDGLATLIQGHAGFQLLWAGHQLGLFSFLSRSPGSTLASVKKHLRLAERPARILLIGLTSLGVITKTGDRHSNARMTEKWLVPERARSFANVLGWQAEIVYPGLLDFVESLKKNRNVGLRQFEGPGNTLYQRLTANPRVEKVFQDSMSALSNQANVELLRVLPLKDSRHLVEAGGGAGTNAIAIARRFSKLNVTVFDSASVCKLATANIKKAGLENRVSTCPGDFFVDPFPKDIDSILFCHIFTIWSPAQALKLLRRSYKALRPGGKLLIFNMMGDDDDTGPISTALGSPYFLTVATSGGFMYSWKEHELRIRKAGFRRVERISGLPLAHGVLVATK